MHITSTTVEAYLYQVVLFSEVISTTCPLFRGCPPSLSQVPLYCYFPSVLRAVRIFRSVSFIRGLQVLVTALIATFLNAMIPLLFLLFVLMFIFSIIGYYWFGYDETGDQEKWGTIGRAMLSLFTFVTVSFPL